MLTYNRNLVENIGEVLTGYFYTNFMLNQNFLLFLHHFLKTHFYTNFLHHTFFFFAEIVFYTIFLPQFFFFFTPLFSFFTSNFRKLPQSQYNILIWYSIVSHHIFKYTSNMFFRNVSFLNNIAKIAFLGQF